MSQDENAAQPAIVVAFLNELIEDRERGIERSLEEYLQRYPGYEAEVAIEYGRLFGDATATVAADGPVAVTLDDDALIRGPVADRYRDDGELGRGGMGTIHSVWDPSLKRQLAKKVLASGQSGSAAALMERFLGEAQVTAQLEHPGIVPVHELGLDAAGRVYFTMSLVRGRDFGQIIDLVHAGREGWTRTRALGVLQRVCEAVSFAHSKGVIHRDLKPANIMVGQFGETYVLDWGLARVGAASEDDSAIDPSGDVSSRPSSPFLTREGEVVGTPAYMSPEQARGERDQVGPRSDVFAIGAMIYHLLDGRPPYADGGSTTWPEMLNAALAGPPTSLRTAARDVPDELIAIQERAMARDPENRYASAHELGEDLRAFLETRVVQAHRTGAVAELSKWIKRNRLAAAAAALALVSLVAGLGTSLWLKRVADDSAERTRIAYEDLKRAKEEADRARLSAEAAKETADLARVSAEAAKEEAELELQIRQAVLGFLNRDLLAAVAPGKVGRDASMRDVLDVAAENIDGRFPEQPLVEAAIRATLGHTYRRLGALAEAERHLSRSIELHEANTAPDSPVTLEARRGLAIVYRYQNRLRDAEAENREILAISRAAFGEEHDDTLTAANNLGLVLNYLGERQEAAELLGRVFELRKHRLGADHDHTLATMCNLGLVYYGWGRYREAEPLIKGELDLCIAKHGEENPGTLVSMNNYANLLSAMGRAADALAEHTRVVRISEKILGPEHPDTVGSMLNRAKVLRLLERNDECRDQLEIARSRVGKFGPDARERLSIAYLDGDLLLASGDVEGTLSTTTELLPRCRRVLGDRAQTTLTVWRLHATALAADGRVEEAVDELRSATAASGDDHSDALSMVRIQRCKLLVDLDRLSEAEAELLAAERFFALTQPLDRGVAEVIELLAAAFERSGQLAKATEWRARLQ